MSLLTALGFAQSSLLNASSMSSLVSRNIANSTVTGASLKSANTIWSPNGDVTLGGVQRSTDAALSQRLLNANSDAAAQSAVSSALDTLNQTVGDPNNNASPAGLISQLSTSLQTLAASPSDLTTAQAAVAAARNLSDALNGATKTVQTARATADSTIANDVDSLNKSLGKFETLNAAIVSGTLSGTDVTDQLDERDQLISSMSKLIGITVTTGANNNVSLFTDSGVTLFQGTPRTVTFTPTSTFAPGVTGNAVYIDNTPVTGPNSPMPIQSGEIAGATQARDSSAVVYQSQLDEMARSLITSFAESSVSANPATAAGLFTYPGAPALPALGQPGLAGSISVASSADPTKGGNAFLLRDGGIAGVAYSANTTGAAGFTGNIQNMIDALSSSQAFAPAAGLASTATLADYSAASAGWLGAERQTATNNVNYQNTIVQTTSQALSNKTGINIDNQMMTMLNVEQSYQASAKLLTTIDTMYSSLFAVINPTLAA